MLNKVLLYVVALSVALSGPAQATETMTLLPVNVTLAGLPSMTLGWGFTISSDTNYLMVFDVSFGSTAGWGGFTGYTTDLGSFVVAPGESVTHAFNKGLQTGVVIYYIHPDAVAGSVTSGTIDVTYGLFSVNPNDPLFNPDTDTVSLGNVFNNLASVTVMDASAVPEPSTFLLFGAGLGGLLLLRRRK